MYKDLSIFSYPNEAWKSVDIKSKLLYEISSLGRVRIIKSSYCCIKIQRIGNHGYPIISIRESKSKIKRLLVHRLVGTCFLHNSDNKRTINHKNGIKSDNRVENLEWATDSEQATHRHYILGKDTTFLASEISKKLKMRPVIKLSKNGDVLGEYASLKEAGISVGKKHQNILEVCKGKNISAHGFKWAYKYP